MGDGSQGSGEAEIEAILPGKPVQAVFELTNMASVREVSSFTEDLLCPICLSLFRDPHMLECGHSFCAPCLETCIPRELCPDLSEKARLLKLDEGAQLSGTGSWYFCEEHEEPLKLFCSQDEAPICVICRDLPEHRGHDFLPIKNAVQTYQVRADPRRRKKEASG
ncbi:zinc-binding protein A33-like [Crotalus adamanteus]|uniref:Zinc-binding protein A33-like n=1 Tax=Crotalus adamanteus TaxID=8729 RepID=A0AAW1BWJ6_CROAD